MATQSLLDVFLAALPEAARSTAAGGVHLAALIDEQLRLAAAAWPTVTIEPALYVAYLAARIPADVVDVGRALGGLQTTDLYLSCACARGDAAALAALERHLIAVAPSLARLRLSEPELQEITQLLRQRLLVGEGGPPLIAQYSGRGHLQGWLRVIAVRAALKSMARGRREIPVEEQVLQALPLATDDAELRYIKELYRGEFTAAFKEALGALSTREANVLLHHYVDGLTTYEIGSLYRVHQTTATRWLEHARETILAQTREHLMRRLHAEHAEVESIMRLVHTHLDLTLRSLLK
jgi:RNA polymerase sigma-70 factor, ECF subfamily